MWKSLYDGLLQLLTIPWAEYLNENKRQGRLVRDTFFNEIYGWSGLVLLLVILISCVLYYFYFNRRFGRYYSLGTYFSWMIISSLLVGITTFIIARSFANDFISPTWSLVTWISFINIFYGVIMFFIISIVCQTIAILVRKVLSIDLSPMGSRTPF